MTSYLENAGYLAILALGFGFVVFWHELGHFLAAKWAGVKVEQFAVGFMQAVVSYRKGLGIRFGTSRPEFIAKLEVWLTDADARKADGTAGQLKGSAADGWTDGDYALASRETKIGETEYRLNWLPLGGYVKMLGQDDLRPNSEADDPRAYNRQPIPKRMIIVSAGVVMNIILAAVGFVVLFSVGFHVPPARVGSVVSRSPAQMAKAVDPKDNGVRIGDEIVSVDGKPTYDDNTKLKLNAALSGSGEEVPMRVRRDGREIELRVTPAKVNGFVQMGVGDAVELVGPKGGKEYEALYNDPARDQLFAADTFALRADEAIVAVNGQPVGPNDVAVLDRAVQAGTKTVTLTVRKPDGTTGVRDFVPSIAPVFGEDPYTINLVGLVPRMQISSIGGTSPSRGRVQPGDVVTAVAIGDGTVGGTNSPSFRTFRQALNDAAKADKPVTVTLLRGGKQVVEKNLMPIQVSRGNYGLGVAPAVDEVEAVVAEVVDGSPAAAGKIPVKATVLTVDGKPVKTWREVHLALRAAVAGKDQGATVKLGYKTEGGEEKSTDLTLAAKDVEAVNQIRYDAGFALRGSEGVRKADGIGQAFRFGMVETRDFILQFYLTLKRMATRDVSPTNLMGPVGIFQAGTHFASKGNDWLLWFLAMISANLAVVNFLPIPVVDGGLFVFLVAEKIKGKPISERTQAIAQYVGLALLLGVFLFVTYQDIANFQFRMR